MPPSRTCALRMNMHAKSQEKYELVMKDEKVINAFTNHGVALPQNKTEFLNQYPWWAEDFKMALFYIITTSEELRGL